LVVTSKKIGKATACACFKENRPAVVK